ncbi:MAG: T9SS type A sorting domain-containing protein, partial [Saprospiraceae bacterium]|nr:T9SS type A sorting domain-containing protein [Saprospiraceae bacterium]
TCTDGIQNQDETGIDCGGSCRACPTCDDALQNQGETGIDCGGPCPACETCDDGVQNGAETGIDCGGDCVPCAVCPAPNQLALQLIGTFAKFTWSKVAAASGYRLELRVRSTNTWVGYELSQNLFSGRLANAKNYDAWRVAARCAENVQSEWSELAFFPGARTGAATASGDFVLYPNPVQSALTLVFDPVPQIVTRYVVLDLNGKPLVSGQITPGTAEAVLDLSLLHPGVYLLQVKSDQLFAVRRFVVQRE